MGTRYLIDSNIAIAYLGDELPHNGYTFLTGVVDLEFNISIVNRIEILGYPKVSESTVDFINSANVLGLTDEVANAAIKIRRKHRIKLPDAIIAAAARVHGLVLLSRNKKDFSNIEGVRVIDPFSL